ncbi:TetR/AcrR family transcriptional regulator; helix-turn-helix transcriptional regulator, partial [bacterium]|nr:TetR/AcrR family transcriptional regulator; helix-turn-helix transcriptional regulator [bacterium]
MKEIKSKDIILDTAEKLFAQKGYAGTSMRVIAEEAGTAQALIHYHYKTKEFLFESIVERRSKVINGNRQQRLRDCFEMEKNRFPSLEAIMESFIQPALECGRSSWGRDYSQILAKLANSDDERSRELVHKYYDPIAREYILALE